ncbi:hypothetical protein D3C73_1340570 [compost metagenome]
MRCHRLFIRSQLYLFLVSSPLFPAVPPDYICLFDRFLPAGTGKLRPVLLQSLKCSASLQPDFHLLHLLCHGQSGTAAGDWLILSPDRCDCRNHVHALPDQQPGAGHRILRDSAGIGTDIYSRRGLVSVGAACPCLRDH